MASGFDIIKRGIMTNDMKMVADGYEMMTGDQVELPRRVIQNDDKGVTGTGIKKRLGGQAVKASGRNLFVDEEGEARAKISTKPKKPSLKKPKREGVKILELKCSSCRDKYFIREDDESLREGRSPLCNTCIINKGR